MPSQKQSQFTVVAVIVIINIAVCIASFFYTDTIQLYGALTLRTLFLHEYWRFFTYMWIHADPLGWGILHIVFNMATLLMFAPHVERLIGRISFAFIYLLGGFTSAAFFFLEYWIRSHFSFLLMSLLPQAVIGASGAVVCIIAVFSSLYPDTRVYIFPIPFPMRVRTAVIAFVVVSASLMFYPPLAFIGHSAHIGGILTGFVYAWIWKKRHLKEILIRQQTE